jgi:hypothetical protein
MQEVGLWCAVPFLGIFVRIFGIVSLQCIPTQYTYREVLPFLIFILVVHAQLFFSVRLKVASSAGISPSIPLVLVARF